MAKPLTSFLVPSFSPHNLHQAWVVKTLDSTIHWINRYPTDKYWGLNCTIHWIEIYPMDSAIQPLNNRGLVVHKFASLRQVNTPSSWDKFQNCCTDMYLIRFLPNFAVFCVFLWISQLRDRAKHQKPCIIRSLLYCNNTLILLYVFIYSLIT